MHRKPTPARGTPPARHRPLALAAEHYPIPHNEGQPDYSQSFISPDDCIEIGGHPDSRRCCPAESGRIPIAGVQAHRARPRRHRRADIRPSRRNGGVRQVGDAQPLPENATRGRRSNDGSCRLPRGSPPRSSRPASAFALDGMSRAASASNSPRLIPPDSTAILPLRREHASARCCKRRTNCESMRAIFLPPRRGAGILRRFPLRTPRLFRLSSRMICLPTHGVRARLYRIVIRPAAIYRRQFASGYCLKFTRGSSPPNNVIKKYNVKNKYFVP